MTRCEGAAYLLHFESDFAVVLILSLGNNVVLGVDIHSVSHLVNIREGGGRREEKWKDKTVEVGM